MENIVISLDQDRALVQASASPGSSGQAKKRARYCRYELTVNITKDPPKIISLFSDTQMSPGNALTRPIKVAPMPIETKSAGRAQHNKVPIAVKSEKKDIQIFFLRAIILPADFGDTITCIT